MAYGMLLQNRTEPKKVGYIIRIIGHENSLIINSPNRINRKKWLVKIFYNKLDKWKLYNIICMYMILVMQF